MPTIFESEVQAVRSKQSKKAVTPLGPLTCFAVNPDGVRFETQEPEESVILFLRQHLIVNLGWVLIALLLLFAPVLVFPRLLDVINESFLVPRGYVLIGTLLWYLGTFGFILAKFLGWFFNIYIVTNERVIDIDFFYLLYKRFSQAELNKIQDISYDSGGVFATFFNYGNVTIETAGEAPNLEFDKVPFPEKVVETIRGLTEKI